MKTLGVRMLVWALTCSLWVGAVGDLAGATQEYGVTGKTKPQKEKPSPGGYLEQAQSAYARGDRNEAMNLINKALKLDQNNPRGYFARARLYSVMGQADKAVEDFTKSLALDPSQTDIYQLRGLEHFKSGHVVDALNDFNGYLSVNPSQAPYHWQRGIALYYTDQFDLGRQQFETHQQVNSNDVENAAWHYFCVARVEGMEKAREKLIPITGDSRIPMMTVHALLAGKATPEEVLKAATAGNPRPETEKQQLFYAHLYLALYYEVSENYKLSREHISKAVALSGKMDYMGVVARIHAKQSKSSRAK